MNGVPKGMTHCTDIPCLGATDEPGNTTNCLAIHAETNMLINSYDTMKIVKVYITTSPCLPCALMLANLPNLKVVKALTRYADERGIEILEIANVTVEIEKEKEPREV